MLESVTVQTLSLRASTPPTNPGQDTNTHVTLSHIVCIEGCTSLTSPISSSKAATVSHSKGFVDSCEHADAHDYEEIPDFPQKSTENQTHDGTFPGMIWSQENLRSRDKEGSTR